MQKYSPLPEIPQKFTLGDAVVELDAVSKLYGACATWHNLLVDQINDRIANGQTPKTP